MSKPYYGIYKALVEYNKDPLHLNRLKVRISGIHNINTPLVSLPWAKPASPLLTDPPLPVGSIVYVAFEMGDVESPIYLGYMLRNAINSQCTGCSRYIGNYRCTTFPNGIPEQIFTNIFIHKRRFNEDDVDEGLFQPKELNN